MVEEKETQRGENHGESAPFYPAVLSLLSQAPEPFLMKENHPITDRRLSLGSFGSLGRKSACTEYRGGNRREENEAGVGEGGGGGRKG